MEIGDAKYVITGDDIIGAWDVIDTTREHHVVRIWLGPNACAVVHAALFTLYTTQLAPLSAN